MLLAQNLMVDEVIKGSDGYSITYSVTSIEALAVFLLLSRLTFVVDIDGMHVLINTVTVLVLICRSSVLLNRHPNDLITFALQIVPDTYVQEFVLHLERENGTRDND